MNDSTDRPERPLRKTLIALITLQCLLTVIFLMMFIYLGLTPFKYTAIITGILLLLIALILVFKRWSGGRIAACIVSAIVSVGLGFGVYLMYSTSSLLGNITSVNTEKHIINVYVRTDNPAQTINDTVGYTYGILETLDRDNTDETIYKISEQLGRTLSITTYKSLTDMADALLKGRCDAIILNENYIPMISELDGYKDIEKKIRVIYSNVVERKVVSNQTANKIITKDSFVVYISGIDTEGPISSTSRSDVNILMAVNPSTGRILLLTTPRDYYIPLSISNGKRDKLTHAGSYGINVSMDTLESLYGIDIDYYIRLNFTSFKKIIDALGGIRVYSDYSFSTENYSFKKGYNNMNGARALEFSRERYAFPEGDRQRGKNQMAVIKAVIDKVTSPAILTRYTSLISSIKGSIQTNISADEIGSLVKKQLNDMITWDISNYSVNGTGSSEYTYTVPNQKAYVMIPDESTIAEAKLKLKEIMQ